MAKQREVEKQFHGRAKNENYYDAMEKAKAADQASYGTVPVQRNAAVDAWFDQHCSCTGCCGHDEDNPENNSSCCTIM
ncbi:MAG: hypothetical protein H6910_00375 [Rickettsiaceae bacterium]|jgi:hypothetical protein|nr:hypothetical protein [Rickettsiaceae bacterium]MCP5377562.1 hypothetical protein [Rickettsiaceae bacterium]